MKKLICIGIFGLLLGPALAAPTASGTRATSKQASNGVRHSSWYYYGYGQSGAAGVSEDPKKKKNTRLGQKGVIPTYEKEPLQGQQTESQMRSSKIPGLVSSPK
jgi:hypothetical protein